MSEKRDSRAVRRSRLFDERLAGCWDEFKWLYCELYGQTDHLNQLMDTARQMFIERRPALVKGLCIGLAVAAGLFFVCYYPVISGMPVAESYVNALRILPSWMF